MIMLVNATEFKNRVGKYLEISSQEDIIILKNGKQVAKLTSIDRPLTPNVDGLLNLLSKKSNGNMDLGELEEIRKERLEKYDSPS
jgi:prevent-host-death family protein